MTYLCNYWGMYQREIYFERGKFPRKPVISLSNDRFTGKFIENLSPFEYNRAAHF